MQCRMCQAIRNENDTDMHWGHLTLLDGKQTTLCAGCVNRALHHAWLGTPYEVSSWDELTQEWKLTHR